MPRRIVTISVPVSVLRMTGRVIGKHTRHRRQVADVAVDHAEEGDDRGLVGGDAVEVAHLFRNSRLHTDFPFPAFTDISGGPITPTLRECPARVSARNPILADRKRRICA